jgi:hypothetical protein
LDYGWVLVGIIVAVIAAISGVAFLAVANQLRAGPASAVDEALSERQDGTRTMTPRPRANPRLAQRRAPPRRSRTQ